MDLKDIFLAFDEKFYEHQRKIIARKCAPPNVVLRKKQILKIYPNGVISVKCYKKMSY